MSIWIYRRRIVVAEGRNSVKQNVIVPGAGHYRFIIPARLTNKFSRIYHAMHHRRKPRSDFHSRLHLLVASLSPFTSYAILV